MPHPIESIAPIAETATHASLRMLESAMPPAAKLATNTIGYVAPPIMNIMFGIAPLVLMYAGMKMTVTGKPLWKEGVS